jgi:hypothetical protein
MILPGRKQLADQRQHRRIDQVKPQHRCRKIRPWRLAVTSFQDAAASSSRRGPPRARPVPPRRPELDGPAIQPVPRRERGVDPGFSLSTMWGATGTTPARPPPAVELPRAMRVQRVHDDGRQRQRAAAALRLRLTKHEPTPGTRPTVRRTVGVRPVCGDSGEVFGGSVLSGSVSWVGSDDLQNTS